MAQTEPPRYDAVTFFDVDGTLVWHELPAPEELQGELEPLTPEEFDAVRPSPATYEAFRRLRANGRASFICTGRPYFMIQPSLHELEPTGFVAEAGAYVRVGDTVVFDAHIPFEDLMDTARMFLEAGIDVDIEGNELDVGLYPSGSQCPFPGCPTVRTLEELEPYARRYRFAKFSTHFVPPERIERVRAFCAGRFSVCDMQFNTFEFSPIGIDKGTGIRCALEHLGHGRERTYGFGDSENDLAMAPAVETFVAMGNALPQVKAAAAFVSDHARDDGVAHALARLGLV